MKRLLLVALVLALGMGLLVWNKSRSRQVVAVSTLDPAVVRIVRTPGGMLEVVTLRKPEVFGWQASYTCPVINCAELLGKTTSEVQVTAHYTYRIPLAAEWKLKFQKDHYELEVPPLEPKLPVAFDTARMRVRTEKDSWLSPASGPNREAVVRNLGAELEVRSQSAEALAMAERQASLTVAEFARRWMTEQMEAPKHAIRVTFAKRSAIESAKATQ
jgi:hypothetical protein